MRAGCGGEGKVLCRLETLSCFGLLEENPVRREKEKGGP